MSNSLAFVFPGQGSQKVGMLAAQAEKSPIIEQTFAEASEALGYDLWVLIQSGPQEELNLTEKTHPMLLTAGVALWRLWQDKGGATPSIMAGHSLGEFTALVCAGSLGFADAVNLVRRRGQFMQTAVPVGEGAMAAVLGLEDQIIQDICNDVEGVVEAVNYNSPGQVVIAGSVLPVEAAIEQCKQAGAKRAMPLPVSAPFHTSLMKPAGDKLREELAGLKIESPEIPVVHNVTAATESDPEQIRNLLETQIFSAVRWVECVQTMIASGVEVTVECGPGKVLSGLNKRIHKPLNCFSLEAPEAFTKALEEI